MLVVAWVVTTVLDRWTVVIEIAGFIFNLFKPLVIFINFIETLRRVLCSIVEITLLLVKLIHVIEVRLLIVHVESGVTLVARWPISHALCETWLSGDCEELVQVHLSWSDGLSSRSARFWFRCRLLRRLLRRLIWSLIWKSSDWWSWVISDVNWRFTNIIVVDHILIGNFIFLLMHLVLLLLLELHLILPLLLFEHLIHGVETSLTNPARGLFRRWI